MDIERQGGDRILEDKTTDTAVQALITGIPTKTGIGNPGKVGYMPADPRKSEEAMSDDPAA